MGVIKIVLIFICYSSQIIAARFNMKNSSALNCRFGLSFCMSFSRSYYDDARSALARDRNHLVDLENMNEICPFLFLLMNSTKWNSSVSLRIQCKDDQMKPSRVQVGSFCFQCCQNIELVFLPSIQMSLILFM